MADPKKVAKAKELMMFVKKNFLGGENFSKVLVILQLKDPEPWSETRPALVLMLENGHCVCMGENSPIITYFPGWSALAFFKNTSLDEYEAKDPSDCQLPEEWNTEATPLGSRP